MDNLIKQTKYINPMIDVAFKEIFGTEKNKHLIKELLEHVFNLEIRELEYVNIEHPGDSVESRNAYFDVACRSVKGEDFIVECQVRTQKYIAERAVFYTAFPIVEQAPRGTWDYNFRPVYFLGLVDFPLPESIGRTDSHIQRFSLRNDENSELMTDHLKYVFMEVGPFDKKLEECKTFEERFLYFMKNLPTFATKPDTHDDHFLEDLLNAAEYSGLSNKMKGWYDRRLKAMRDAKNVEDFAREQAINEGLAEGRAKGREEGLAEGKAEGLAEGKAKGKAEGKAEVAKTMLADGIEISIVSKYTGLSEEDLSKLL